MSSPPRSITRSGPLTFLRPVMWRRLLLRGLRRAFYRAGSALREWTRPENNPFLALALLREVRRHKPFLTLTGLALIAALAIFGGFRAWCAMDALIAEPRWTSRLSVEDVAANTAAREAGIALPAALGGNIFGFAALITLGTCVYFALWATRARATNTLRTASLGGALGDWQLLPLREERWTWMLTAYPFAIALLCGLAGLPVYAMAVFTGEWSTGDLLGVTMLFGWLGTVVPAWTPRAWMGMGGKFDTKKYQQLVREARRGRVRSEMSPAEAMEVERRVARALIEAYDGPMTARSRRGGSTIGRTIGRAVGVFFGIQFLGSLLLSVARTGTVSGIGGPLVVPYLTALPPGTLDLVPSFPISWPLLLARVLVAPLPFFARHLPPLVLLLPMVILLHQSSFARLAAGVSASETFWNRRRARARRNRTIVLWLLGIAFVAGYGWPVLIEGGVAAYLLPGSPLTRSAALAGFWTLLIVAATLFACERPIHEPLRRVRAGELGAARAWGESVREAARTFGAAIGIFVLFCALGGALNPGPVWRGHALPVLFSGLAFVLVEWGFATLRTALSGEARDRCAAWRILWFYGPIAAYLIGAGVEVWHKRTFLPGDAPWLLLSPFAMLIGLFRPGIAPPATSFALAWMWPCAANVLLGLLLTGAAAARTFGHVTAPTAEPLEIEMGGSWLGRLFAALRSFGLALLAAIGKFFAFIARAYEALNAALLRFSENSENPILRAEMRRRLRREAWIIQWVLILGAVTFFFGESLNPNSGIGPSSGIRTYQWGEGVLSIATCMTVMGALLLPAKLGVCLDRERANGQLAFLFLTPLTDREILLGKWIPEIIHTSGLLAAALLPLGVGAGVMFLSGNSAAIPALLGALALIGIVLFWSSLAQLAAATRARKAGEGANRGLLAIFGLEAALLAVFLLLAYALSDYGSGPPEGFFWFALVSSALANAGAAYLAWRLALRWFKATRNGEGGTSGVVSN